MPTIFFIPTRDETCVRTEGGTVEIYFATVEDLKIALWLALIYPAAHKRQLNDLENGFRASIAITEARWKALYANVARTDTVRSDMPVRKCQQVAGFPAGIR